MATSLVLSFAFTRLAVYLFVETPYRLQQNANLPKITRDAILIVFYTVLTFFILRTQGNINLAGLITTSAVLTAVIGFAAQGPLSNFFAGLMIQMERPYVLGDWIRIGDWEGKVTGLTWKATYLETRESIQVYLPNMLIANETFENLSKPDRLITGVMSIGVEYGAPPNKVRDVIFAVLKQHPQVLGSPESEVRLINFGDFAITYEIRFWHRNFPGEPRMKADINDRLWYALRRNGIKIPFPIRDVQHAHIERRRDEALQAEARSELGKLLETIPVIEPLSTDELGWLSRQVECQEFGKHEPVVEQGHEGHSMYILRSGTCAVTVRAASGSVSRVATLKAGDFFGEMTLMTGEPRSATVRTLEDTSVFRVAREHLATLLEQNPAMADQMGKILGERREQLAQETHSESSEVETVQQVILKIRKFFKILD